MNLGLTADGPAAQIKLQSVCGRLPGVQAVLMSGDQAATGTLPFAQRNRKGAEGAVHEPIDESDVCAISFTSGTTGVPKDTMAMHTNAIGCVQNIMHAAKGLGVDDINICMPPLTRPGTARFRT